MLTVMAIAHLQAMPELYIAEKNLGQAGKFSKLRLEMHSMCTKVRFQLKGFGILMQV